MSDALIVCENCGKKFRLPETYKSPKAKCTQCGSAIDVAGQRAAASAPAAKPAPVTKPAVGADAPKPAAPRPAAAKPAASREVPAAPRAPSADRTARRGTESSASSASGRRSSGKAAESEGSSARRGRGEAPAKKSQMPLLLGAGGVVVLGVVAFLLMNGGEAPKNPPAPAPAPVAAEPSQKPAATPAAEAPATAQAAPAAAVSKPAEPAPAAPAPVAKLEDVTPKADATPATATETSKPAAEEKKPEPKVSADNWMNSKVTAMDQVFDPKKDTDEVVWAAYISDADKSEIMGQLDIIRDGGVKSAGAKTKLEKMGHKATFGIISRLREIDYKDSFDAMYGWELNKVLETITGGMNVGYAPVLVGEDMDPRKADWNARTAKAWLALPKQFETEEAFDEMVRKRRDRSK